jgi:hypothetical protein
LRANFNLQTAIPGKGHQTPEAKCLKKQTLVGILDKIKLRLFLFPNIAPLDGFHIGGSLLEDGFFGYIDSRRAEDVLKPCPMGGAGKVNGVSGEAMYPVLGASGKGGLDKTGSRGRFPRF